MTGMLFNHESPRRGYEFVTRKITSGVAQILAGRADILSLGNLDARRDWGHARDYVEAMWLMLQQATPEDYVVAAGETHSVREFAEIAFRVAGLDARRYIRADAAFFRPAEVDLLLGDATRAKKALGWEAKTSFEALVREMVVADCRHIGVNLEAAA